MLIKLVGAVALSFASLVGVQCSAGYQLADPSDLAKTAAEALEQQTGALPNIDCGSERVKVIKDESVVCALTTDAGAVYDTTITFTEIDGSDYKFRVKVADTPRS